MKSFINRIFILKKHVIALVLFICIASCTNKKEPLEEKEFQHKYGEKLMQTNQKLVKKDQETIENYIKRHKWNMQVTGSGLYVEIYKKGSGKQAEAGKQATIKYKITLLDGTVCYDSDVLGNKTFKISQGGVEAGLEEGILLMNEGSQSRFILPPHLAHGLVGDDNKIHPRAIIIYNVELLKIQE